MRSAEVFVFSHEEQVGKQQYNGDAVLSLRLE